MVEFYVEQRTRGWNSGVEKEVVGNFYLELFFFFLSNFEVEEKKYKWICSKNLKDINIIILNCRKFEQLEKFNSFEKFEIAARTTSSICGYQWAGHCQSDKSGNVERIFLRELYVSRPKPWNLTRHVSLSPLIGRLYVIVFFTLFNRYTWQKKKIAF